MTQTAIFDAQAAQNTEVEQTTVPVFTANAWKSSWVSVKDHRRLTGIVALNQPSAANGVVVEQSNSTAPSTDADAHYWTSMSASALQTNPVTGQTYYNVAYSIERVGLYARLIVKHAGVAPTTFNAKLIGAGIT